MDLHISLICVRAVYGSVSYVKCEHQKDKTLICDMESGEGFFPFFSQRGERGLLLK